MKIKRIASWAGGIFYVLIMIEVIVMVSPFALFWYSWYTPALQGIYRSPWTAWLENFFLPHSVVTTSPVLEFFRWKLGPYLFSLGLIAFLVLAVQVYSAKLLQRGIVTGGIYRYIRHPQYLCLAIAGLGLLSFWPRFIILLFYFGMVVAYYFLAKSEERRLAAAHPEYSEYQKRTSMFLPGSPGKSLRRLLFGWIKNPAYGTAAYCVTAVAAGLAIGFLLRSYTLAHVEKVPVPGTNMLVIGVWPRGEDWNLQVVQTALQDQQVRDVLAKEGNTSFSIHPLPYNYGMINMFADFEPRRSMFGSVEWSRWKRVCGFVFPFLESLLGPRRYPVGTPMSKLKVVFSRMEKPHKPFVPVSEITDMTAKKTTVAIVEMDASKGQVLKVLKPLQSSRWGNITMPIF